MLARPERRRILLVVSDGCPMDTATSLANDEFYLAQHLKQVVARREAQGAVEICGLGLGLDLGAYYSRSLATTLPASLNNELFSEITIGGAADADRAGACGGASRRRASPVSSIT
jgi:cobaltochelatase CobT